MYPDYHLPATVKEALTLLGRKPGEGRVMAGGTDLMIKVKAGEINASVFVDVTRIAEMRGIRAMRNGYIWVGAAVTHNEAGRSPLIRAKAALLAAACRAVGALQIQNAGTLGGNVVNALPAADGTIALMALGAEAQVASVKGKRWVKLADFFLRPGVCKADPCRELLVGFRFKALKAREGCAFERLARRRALALPMLNCGVVVRLNPAGTRVKRATIAMGPVAPVPFRATAAEKLLAGARVTDELWQAAAEIAAMDANPRPSPLRGPTEYRKNMVAILARRALMAAAAQARKK